MNEVSLFQQDIGIASIRKLERGRLEMPAQSDAHKLVGGRVKETLRSLYDQTTIEDLAIGLTVPTLSDTELQLPHKFHAALREVIEKIEFVVAAQSERADPKGADANSTDSEAAVARRTLSHTQKVDAAQKQYGYNLSALSMA